MKRMASRDDEGSGCGKRRVRWMRLAAATGILLCTGAVAIEPTSQSTTQPTTVPVVTMDSRRAEAVAEFAAELKDVLPATAVRLEDVFELRLTEKLVTLVTRLPATDGEVGLLPPGEAAPIGKYSVLRDDDGIAPPVPGEAKAEPTEPKAFNFIVTRVGEPEMVSRRVEIHTNPAIGHFNLTYVETTMDGTMSADLIQHPTEDVGELPLRLNVTFLNAEEEQTGTLRLAAESFAELRKGHPEETARYLRPAFEMIGHAAPLFGVDARLAWQVLGPEAKPDAALSVRLKEVLRQLESAVFADREAAQKVLRELGQPAAMALRGWDRAALSPQQNAEIDAFLAESLAPSSSEAERYRSSPDFLLDVMALEDQSLRTTAWERLEKLRAEPAGFSPAGFSPAGFSPAGLKQVRFNPAGTLEERTAQIAALRARLLPATTRPATDPADKRAP